ncbi:MAG: indolepyruvate ferredoxin oxidoreductase [Candidatus Aminicenantes bacterium]|nr:indolepyruvate ferredoxin oxidoreductase [Candidatus Aminicenantes bacterium]
MKPEVLLGDEAVALGAVHAGLSAAYSYPGTPASEILEYLLRRPSGERDYTAVWSVNEKTAYEEALGASFAGRRALVSMKHVGLNVAADPFMNSALTGVGGGLVVVAADDPGMHSSQNEQDSRTYADFARIFCFEPAGHQEAYDMAREAFDLSEKFDIPVMLRLTTRISHSRSVVAPREARSQNPLRLGQWQDWTLLPVNARRRFQRLLERQPELRAASEASPFNALTLNPRDRRLGIIASGIAWNYVQENVRDLETEPSLLKVSTYPMPESLIRRLTDHAERVLVAEDGYPLIERMLRGLYGVPGKTILGRMSGELPAAGELSPDLVRTAMGLKPLKHYEPGERPLAGRPPQLCAGCPHTDTLKALTEALRDRPGSNVFSDIGCYTLGALPPYNAVQTCVCMGASISMARGGSDAGIRPAVAVIGDSTFGHSGITSLLSAARADADMTVFILDNGTVAMTGGQTSCATGPGLLKIIEGAGVPPAHIRVIEPLPRNHERNVQIIREELDHKGLSVIVAVRECVTYSSKRRG